MAQSLIFLSLAIPLNQWFSSVAPGQQHQHHLELIKNADSPTLPRPTESETEDEPQLSSFPSSPGDPNSQSSLTALI